MSTNKYKWLTLSLASVVISGCAVGSKPNLNLGIADAFRKSKNSLFKKKVSYGAPAVAPGFGYATPAINGTPISLPSQDGSITLSDVTVMSDQSAITSASVPSDCNCNNNIVYGPVDEFYMPVGQPVEMVDPPIYSAGETLAPSTALPFEASNDTLQLENPLPAAIEVPDTPTSPSIATDPTEEEGVIESLDSASINLEEAEDVLNDIDDDFNITPKKDEASILDTAVKELEAKTPTSAGHSVVEQRSKMLTLTARPVQTHQASVTQNRQTTKANMQQVTHKRHFRQQNALRPLHQKFRSKALERTAEAPGPLKFKPLPVMTKESPKGKSSDTNTGAPALNTSPSSETLKRSSTKVQVLPSPVKKLESKTEQKSSIKIARLPILRAESTSSAAIGSLRNFTNVRDLDPGFDKGYYSRKNAEAAAARAAQVIADNVSGSSDDLLIER